MEVTIRDTGDLRRLARDLKQASNGKQLRQEFTRAVRDALRPVVAEAKAAYLAAPSQGHASASRQRQGVGDLRLELAKATGMQVRTSGKQAGVRVAVAGKKMPTGRRGVPRYWEGTSRRPWRHPVFGDRATWVAQPRMPRVFYPAVERHRAAVNAAVDRAADEVRSKLEHPGGNT